MTRARLEYYPRLDTYIVVDTHYDAVVLQTSNYSVADYWRKRVNLCEHPYPYDITDHDRIVEQSEEGLE